MIGEYQWAYQECGAVVPPSNENTDSGIIPDLDSGKTYARQANQLLSLIGLMTFWAALLVARFLLISSKRAALLILAAAVPRDLLPPTLVGGR
jgi:hypothetical protein